MSTYHSVVLELRLAERRGVAGNDDELGLSRSQALQRRLVSEGDPRESISIRSRVSGAGGLTFHSSSQAPGAS